MKKREYHLRFLLMLLVVAIGTQLARAQQAIVTGTVSDAAGEPLIGVSVTVPGTSTGTVTDIDAVSYTHLTLPTN